MDNRRKLLIHGINKLVSDGRITLASTGQDQRAEAESGHIITELLGHPTAICWSDIGFEELRVSVWWKYDHSQHPQANLEGSFREQFHTSEPLAKREHYPKFVGAIASGWLERKKGPHLQGKGAEGIFDVYIRRGEKTTLDAIPVPVPNGFAAEGKVYL